MTKPERIAKAKKYLNNVVDEMAQSENDMRDELRETIRDIINTSFAFGIINKSFQFKNSRALENKIDEILETYCSSVNQIITARSLTAKTLSEKKNDDNVSDDLIVAFIGRKIAEETMQDRLKRYSIQLKKQIEAYISAGYAKGWKQEKILSEYMKWINTPLISPLLLQAYRDSAFASELIRSKGITYGTGNYTSVLANAKRLEQDSIFQAYNYADNIIWSKRDNIIGWASYRGSNYPCSLCDAEVGIIKPLSRPFYQYHSRCVCIAIPIYREDIVGGFYNI